MYNIKFETILKMEKNCIYIYLYTYIYIYIYYFFEIVYAVVLAFYTSKYVA